MSIDVARFVQTSEMQVHLQFPNECSRNSHCHWLTVQRYEIRAPFLSATATYGTLHKQSFQEMQFFLLSADNKRVCACLYGRFFVILCGNKRFIQRCFLSHANLTNLTKMAASKGVLAAASGWKHSVLTPTSKGEATCLCEISEILKVIWDLIFRVFREICVR